MVKIVYTKWGLANRFDDCIELNENLKKYPKLQAQLLDHEVRHTDKSMSVFDLKHDLSSQQEIDSKALMFFMLKHPKSLTQILPFYYSPRRKKLIYDLNLIITSGLFFTIIITGIFVFFKFLN